MRVLFATAGKSPAAVYSIASLATAVRNAGHQVIVAAFDELVPTILSVGLSPVSTSKETMDSVRLMERTSGPIELPTGPENQVPFVGTWFGRHAAMSLDGLIELCRAWRPSLVVGATCTYAAGIVARHIGVPHVMQKWDWLDYRALQPHAEREMWPELNEFGLSGVPEPDLCLEICPPSLALPNDAAATRSMRWMPGNRQQSLEPWMYVRGRSPRVCLTLGSMIKGGADVAGTPQAGSARPSDELCGLIEKLAAKDVEVVVAGDESLANEVRERCPGVHSGWVPLELLVPTCDVLVHHGGGVTSMVAMNAGTPQIVWPPHFFHQRYEALAGRGAAIVLSRVENSMHDAADAIDSVLSNDSYRQESAALAAEIAGLPDVASAVDAMEELVA